jgi:hypothetical protein
MTITIELTRELEAGLAAQAAERGVSLQQYLLDLLQEQAALPLNSSLTMRQRADFWRRSTADLPRTPPLSDQAIGRETIYDSRG